MKRVLVISTLLMLLSSCSYYIGKPKLARGFKGNPAIIGNVFMDSYAHKVDCDTNHPLIKEFAAQALPPIDQVGKHDFIRTIIAKFTLHQDVAQMNEYIMALKPWKKPGTDWALHKNGDYDFAMIPWCMLLNLFDKQPDVLYPQTAEHIAKVLLIHERHWAATRTPGTLDILRETENHIFMGEISRYLQNQWLFEHGDSVKKNNNAINGMEQWMRKHLQQKMQGGYYEFNSNPYSGYSMAALLTLYSFAHSDSIRKACGELIDQTVLEYAMGSLDQRRFPPFRRRLERAGLRSFDEDPFTAYIRTWLSMKYPARQHDYTKNRTAFGLTALVLKYRLNDRLGDLLNNKQFDYLSRMGHGIKSSPEIYSGGPGYLITAGGAQRGKASQIVALPTTLLLHDNQHSLDSCFYLSGIGKMSKWNNTGVFQKFACGPLPVHVPQQYKPLYKLNGWQIFDMPMGGYVLVYNADNVGLLFIVKKTDKKPSAIVNEMVAQNAMNDLHNTVLLPNGELLEYDLHAHKSKWVIMAENSKKLNRQTSRWTRFELENI